MAKHASLTSTTVPSLLTVGTAQVFDDIYSKRRADWHREDLFTFKTTKRAHEDYQEFGAAPEPEAWSGNVAYEAPNQGYEKTLTPAHYDRGFQVDKYLEQVDQYNIARTRASSFGLAFARYQEQSGMNVFNNAFASETSADGQYLCDTDHSTTVSTDTFDNNGTAQLSRVNIWTEWNKARQIKGDRGQILSLSFDELLVPLAKQEMAFEINGSEKRPHTGDNEPNFFNGTFKLYVSPFLTSDYYWFMMDSEMRKQELIWLDLEKVNMETGYDMDTRTYKFAWHAQWARGAVGFRWIYGEEATA